MARLFEVDEEELTAILYKLISFILLLRFCKRGNKIILCISLVHRDRGPLYSNMPMQFRSK